MTLENNLTESKVKLALRFYQIICKCPVIRLNDIPPASLDVILLIDERDLKSSVVRAELASGKSENSISKRYGVCRQYVRNRRT